MESEVIPTIEDVMFGRDKTPGIVSISVSGNVARIWRRSGDTVSVTAKPAPGWIVLGDLSLLKELDPSTYKVMELEGGGELRFLVVFKDWTRSSKEIASRAGVKSIYDLKGILVLPPLEQFLIAHGMTYFKGMSYEDLHRMQFDLETDGLDPSSGRIILIAIGDNRGMEVVLHEGEKQEKEIIEEFCEIVRERDPDILEGYNIFGFDMPFLMARAKALGAEVSLGRGGRGVSSYEAVLKIGGEVERFTKYKVEGREMVDILHAVKRWDASRREMRGRHDLKTAARHFGVSPEGREYIDGAEIASVWRRDPDRVIRYALDDVREVRALSELLMGSTFALAQMIPTSYEKLAHSGTAGLIDLLMIRGYLMHRHAIPIPKRISKQITGGEARIIRRGVVHNVVKADVASMYPNIMLNFGIKSKSDELGISLKILSELTRLRLKHKGEMSKYRDGSPEYRYHDAIQGAMKILINSFYGYMGTSFSHFNDAEAADAVTTKGREILKRMCEAIEKLGGDLVEIDTDGAYFSLPSEISDPKEHREFVERVNEMVGEGVTIEYDGSWPAMYSYEEKNYALLSSDGKLLLKGVVFKSSEKEEFLARFTEEAIRLILMGRKEDLRRMYLDLVERIRRRELPVQMIAKTTRLGMSTEEYLRSSREKGRIAHYEVLISSGRRANAGEYVSYYNCGTRKNESRWKLVEDYDNDYNVEFYLARLEKEIELLRPAFEEKGEFEEIFRTEELSLF